ncbi:MAG: hypothetical protein K8T20_08585, partial [Planctomycetes bacterium]|nr:hypothetical protein [Planctomycetota bacterium]
VLAPDQGGVYYRFTHDGTPERELRVTTLLFTRVRAVVTARGGQLSHGAIVARELGVPCVLWPDACTRFAPASRLRVDGDRGEVTLVT